MKRLLLLVLVLGLSWVFLGFAAAADNFPAQSPVVKPAPGPQAAPPQQRLYYGYVPPAPIRHTWPGGYRVIFHEMQNTLSEHLLGQY